MQQNSTTARVSNASSHPWLDHVQIQRYDRLYDAKPSTTMPLGEALDAICEGVYAWQIARLRQLLQARGEEAYAQAKRHLPALTFAGTFAPTRAKHHLQQHSGVVHADLDHLSDLHAIKLTLMEDPHVVYCFVSPRGDGLKYGVRITPVGTDEAYQHAWQVIAEDHRTHYGITWDPTGKDVGRLCYVSWDPSTYINPTAAICGVPAMVIPPPPVVPRLRVARGRQATYGERALAQAVAMIEAAGDGHKHHARRSASYLLGGYIAGGLLTYDEAYRALEAALTNTARHPKQAMQTIRSGLLAGQAKPITASQLRARDLAWQAAHWHTRTIRAEEIPAWHG